MPTVEAIVGNKVAPGLLDHYLARTGYESQQTDEPADPDRPNDVPLAEWIRRATEQMAPPRSTASARFRSLSVKRPTNRPARPAPGNYRVWAQFLRGDKLSTVAFDLCAERLR
jgi:hypothetical protein